jgi:hypothetical protein
MTGQKLNLHLPQSLKTIGQPDFGTIVCAELGIDPGPLPLQRFCRHGGWPDDDDLEIAIEDVAQRGGKTFVTIGVCFTELVPTGCSDIKHHEDASGSLEVVLDPGADEAYILSDDDEGW